MSHSKVKFATSSFLHLVGILVLFVLFSSLFISEQTGLLIYGLVGDSQISSQILTPLVIVFGLSTAIWATGVFAYHSLTRRDTKTLTRTTGTIMTETLIVLPIFLLLTSGLAQMGINSMAGLLTTVGTFEAGRTMAVWGPEAENSRIGEKVSKRDILRHARLAAAVIVAPVQRTLRSDSFDLQGGSCASDLVNRYTTGMEAAAGFSSSSAVANLGELTRKKRIWSYAEAFGTESFSTRAYLKVHSAYCAMKIDQSSFDGIPTSGPDGGDFVVKVTYNHKPIFPLVQKIFGNTQIKRSYRMRSHIPPNDCLPESPDFFDFSSSCARN